MTAYMLGSTENRRILLAYATDPASGLDGAPLVSEDDAGPSWELSVGSTTYRRMLPLSTYPVGSAAWIAEMLRLSVVYPPAGSNPISVAPGGVAPSAFAYTEGMRLDAHPDYAALHSLLNWQTVTEGAVIDYAGFLVNGVPGNAATIVQTGETVTLLVTDTAAPASQYEYTIDASVNAFILQQPQPVDILEGGTANFSVFAPTAAAYLWEYSVDGTVWQQGFNSNLQASYPSWTGTASDGSAGNTWQITDAHVDMDTMLVRCYLSGAGNFITNEVTLSVTDVLEQPAVLTPAIIVGDPLVGLTSTGTAATFSGGSVTVANRWQEAPTSNGEWVDTGTTGTTSPVHELGLYYSMVSKGTNPAGSTETRSNIVGPVVAVEITATVAPQTSVLVVGQALQDTVNWATFSDPANYSSPAGAIDTVVINYVGDTGNAVQPFGDGDVNWFTVTVTDVLANAFTFTPTPREVVYEAPSAANNLVDQVFTNNTGSQEYNTFGDFTGGGLTFEVNTVEGVSINPTTGIVSFDTTAMPLQADTAIVVTARNSGGSATSGFNVTIEAVSVNTDFVMTITTPSPDFAFKLPLRSGGTYLFDVDWGDGTPVDTGITSVGDPKLTHIYSGPADTYVIRCSGVGHGVYFNAARSSVTPEEVVWADCVDSVSSLGIFGSYLNSSFAGCRRMTSFALGNCDTSAADNMYAMFWRCTDMTSCNVSGIDTSSVTNMLQTFAQCNSLTTLTGLDEFNTTNVTIMAEMIAYTSLADVDIDGFNVTNLTNANGMLAGTDISPGQYNTTLIAWDAQAVLSGVIFNVGSVIPTGGAALDARTSLIGKGWTIVDGLVTAPGQMSPPSLVVDGTDQITVTFGADPVDDGGAPIVRYTLQYSTDPAFVTDVTTLSNRPGPTEVLTGLLPDRTYYVRTRAVSEAQPGAYSTATSATTEAIVTPPGGSIDDPLNDDPALYYWWDPTDDTSVSSGATPPRMNVWNNQVPSMFIGGTNVDYNIGGDFPDIKWNGNNICRFSQGSTGRIQRTSGVTAPTGDFSVHFALDLKSIITDLSGLCWFDTPTFSYILDAGNASQFDGRVSGTNLTTTNLTGGPFLGGLIVQIEFDFTGGEVRTYINNTPVATSAITGGITGFTSPFSTFRLGAGSSLGSNWAELDFGDAIFTEDMTLRADYYAYLAPRWGLTAPGGDVTLRKVGEEVELTYVENDTPIVLAIDGDPYTGIYETDTSGTTLTGNYLAAKEAAGENVYLRKPVVFENPDLLNQLLVHPALILYSGGAQADATFQWQVGNIDEPGETSLVYETNSGQTGAVITVVQTDDGEETSDNYTVDFTESVPRQMDAPKLRILSDTAMEVTLASDPRDNGLPIIRRDIQWRKVGDVSWTEVIGFTSGNSITGLTGNDVIDVQARAVNNFGGAGLGLGPWSETSTNQTAEGAGFDISTLTPFMDYRLRDPGSVFTDANLSQTPANNGTINYIKDSSGNGFTIKCNRDRYKWNAVNLQVNAPDTAADSWMEVIGQVENIPQPFEMYMQVKTNKSNGRWIGLHNQAADALFVMKMQFNGTGNTDVGVGSPVYTVGLTDTASNQEVLARAVVTNSTVIVGARNIDPTDLEAGKFYFLNDGSADQFNIGSLGRIILTPALTEKQRADLVTKLALEAPLV